MKKIIFYPGILSLSLLAACGPAKPPASIATIAPIDQWHNAGKQDFISFKDDEIQIGLTPYNGGKNIPQFKDEFFVFAEIMVDIPGYEFDPSKVELKLAGKTWPATGFDCKPPAPIESKTARKPIGKFEFSEQYNCAWLRFNVPPPSVDSEFSLSFNGLKFREKDIAVPPVSFKKGAVKSMFGF